MLQFELVEPSISPVIPRKVCTSPSAAKPFCTGGRRTRTLLCQTTPRTLRTSLPCLESNRGHLLLCTVHYSAGPEIKHWTVRMLPVLCVSLFSLSKPARHVKIPLSALTEKPTSQFCRWAATRGPRSEDSARLAAHLDREGITLTH